MAVAVNELEREEKGAPKKLATAARWPRIRTSPYVLSIDLVKIKSKLEIIILNLITAHNSH